MLKPQFIELIKRIMQEDMQTGMTFHHSFELLNLIYPPLNQNRQNDIKLEALGRSFEALGIEYQDKYLYGRMHMLILRRKTIAQINDDFSALLETTYEEQLQAVTQELAQIEINAQKIKADLHHLLTVSDDEWQAAQDFFDKYPEKIKKSRDKASPHSHSFLKGKKGANRRLYAIAAKSYLGVGGFGKVKIGQLQKDGANITIRIDGKAFTPDQTYYINREQTRIGYLHDYLEILFDEPKPLLKNYKSYNPEALEDDDVQAIHKETLIKRYSVFTLLPGTNVQTHINNHPLLTIADRLLIALKVAIPLLRLQSQRLLHNDVKAQNAMVSKESYGLVDFEFLMRLGRDDSFIEGDQIMGTMPYLAPELLEEDSASSYSFASDNYAFAKSVLHDLGFADAFARVANQENSHYPDAAKLYQDLENKDPLCRPPMTEVISRIITCLEKTVARNDEEVKKVIDQAFYAIWKYRKAKNHEEMRSKLFTPMRNLKLQDKKEAALSPSQSSEENITNKTAYRFHLSNP